MLKAFVTNDLRWEFRQGLSILRDGEHRVLDMRHNKRGAARVISGTERWALYNQGFWNPRLVVTHNDQAVVVVDGYAPGNIARIDLPGGRSYDLEVRREPAVRVSFRKLDGTEILRYDEQHARPKPRTVFEVLDRSIPNDDLLLLVVLGCHAFLGIQAEVGTLPVLPKRERRTAV